MPRVSHPDDGMVYACPECNTTRWIYERTGTGNAYRGDPDKQYHCSECSTSFDELNERQNNSTNAEIQSKKRWNHARERILKRHGLWDGADA